MNQNTLWKLFFYVFSIIQPVILSAQVEDCTNGIDDDNDGLIDLWDIADCSCWSDTIAPDFSLIPNHSGEYYDICPDDHSQTDYATDWFSVGVGTDDFFYQGCYEGFPEPNWMPLPPEGNIPDGVGYFGCIFSASPEIDKKKEYVGACFETPLEGGKAYTLQFYLGFGTESPPVQWPFKKYVSPSLAEVALYLHSNCSTEPYDGNYYAIDDWPFTERCPTDYQIGWERVATTIVEGENEWIKAQINFSVPENMELNQFIIGATCETHPLKTYYFLDEFILAESKEFNILNIVSDDADLCFGGSKTLKTNMEGDSYQWYKNGIAIANATGEEYEVLPDAYGDYQVRITVDGVCQLSPMFSIKEEEIPIMELS